MSHIQPIVEIPAGAEMRSEGPRASLKKECGNENRGAPRFSEESG